MQAESLSLRILSTVACSRQAFQNSVSDKSDSRPTEFVLHFSGKRVTQDPDRTLLIIRVALNPALLLFK
jgi:hypothetical protein